MSSQDAKDCFVKTVLSKQKSAEHAGQSSLTSAERDFCLEYKHRGAENSFRSIWRINVKTFVYQNGCGLAVTCDRSQLQTSNVQI